MGFSPLYIYLSKLLPLLVLPIGVVIELSLLALVFLYIGRRKGSAAFLVSALLVLWVSSMPIVAGTLYGKLEQDFPPVALEDIPVSDCTARKKREKTADYPLTDDLLNAAKNSGRP